MMSYMPAQVKTEIFELTETHPILTFLKMTEKMFFHKKTILKIKSYLFLKKSADYLVQYCSYSV